jgi:hypothetical protein
MGNLLSSQECKALARFTSTGLFAAVRRKEASRHYPGNSVVDMGNLFSPEENGCHRSSISHFLSAKSLFLN